MISFKGVNNILSAVLILFSIFVAYAGNYDRAIFTLLLVLTLLAFQYVNKS